MEDLILILEHLGLKAEPPLGVSSNLQSDRPFIREFTDFFVKVIPLYRRFQKYWLGIKGIRSRLGGVIPGFPLLMIP